MCLEDEAAKILKTHSLKMNTERLCYSRKLSYLKKVVDFCSEDEL